MTDPFDALIHQLGEWLGLPLTVDRNHACAIRVNNTLTIQIQIDASQEKILIASFLCQLPPGKFTENVLCEALKANNLPDPRTGIFGYLKKGAQLSLHQRYPFAPLDGKQLAMYVAGFIDYAELWRDAIARGQPGPAPIYSSAKGAPNPFGLQR